MSTYLTYSPIAVLIVFIYVIYRWVKAQKEFRRDTGINTFSPLDQFRFVFKKDKTAGETAAYKKLKKESTRSFIIWLITILAYMVITILVGVLTSKQTAG